MKRVEIQGRRRLLDGFFKVDEVEVAFERFDGTMAGPVRRLIAERGDSAAAVVFDPAADRLLFAEQFRFPTVEKGPGWLLELIAGNVDDGETPDAAVRREMEEELGYRAAHVEPTDEGRVAGGGGVASEGEDISVVAMTPAAARAALLSGQIADAKTIIGLQWLFFQRRAAQEE
jgi:hypothetical protein